MVTVTERTLWCNDVSCSGLCVCVLPVQYIVILVVVLLAELSLIIFAALFPTMVRYYDDDDDDVSLTYTPYRYTLIIGAATCVSGVVCAHAKEFAPPQLFWRWELHSS